MSVAILAPIITCQINTANKVAVHDTELKNQDAKIELITQNINEKLIELKMNLKDFQLKVENKLDSLLDKSK